MQMTKTQKILAVIVAVLVLFGAYMAINKNSEVVTPTESNINVSATTTDTKTVQKNGYTIEQVAIVDKKKSEPVPDLNRQVALYPGAIIAPEAKASAVPKIVALQTKLKANTSDVVSWIDLGIYQKMAGDYAGSVISWKYASKLSPTDYVSLGNLGNLYAYFIKDNAQAEVYYKLAITKSPIIPHLYIQLAEAYRDVFQDMVKAKAIIEEGLKKVPNDPSLMDFKSKL